VRRLAQAARGALVLPALVLLTLALLAPADLWAASYHVGLGEHGEGGPLFHQGSQPVIRGTTDAPEGSEIRVELRAQPDADRSAAEKEALAEALGEATVLVTFVRPDSAGVGTFAVRWPHPLPGGTYTATVTVLDPEGQRLGRTESLLVVQAEGPVPRRPLVAEGLRFVPPTEPDLEDFEAFTDRWRLVPPPYELHVEGGRWDPYNQNRLKGDYPVIGQDVFLVVTGVADSLGDAAQLPTPAGVSTNRPGSIEFFGDDAQVVGNQLLLLSGDLFRGDTAFEPVRWRVKGTLAFNLNHVQLEENAGVSPDVRDGVRRTRGFAALQELFGEKRLKVLSDRFDFLSLRVGIQPFNSDFRGFVFTDINLGARLFGNLHSNRTQYNLAFFERLEKDTNSGLNTFEMRDQRVAVANVYRQDFLVKGYTAQASVHWVQDDATFVFDKNDFLVRPDPIGSFTPHQVEATYLGIAGLGHIGRLNLDHALYYVFGDDSLNPIAGKDVFAGRDDVDISAGMVALEVSYDRDWYRPKFALLWATGDDDPTDRTARGFDAIFDNPAFAGGGFTFWNRLGIRLPATGVALVHRGSLLPNLKASKEEGQPNFVNPGLRLIGVGLDVEATPELKVVLTANHLAFDTTESLELLLFQSDIDRDIGWDLSLGARWRPFLNNNLVVLGGVSALLPGDGFEAIYEDDDARVGGFLNVKAVF